MKKSFDYYFINTFLLKQDLNDFMNHFTKYNIIIKNIASNFLKENRNDNLDILSECIFKNNLKIKFRICR